MLLIIFEVSSLLTQNNNAWSFHIIIIIIIIISIRNPDSEFKGSVYIQDQIIIGTINNRQSSSCQDTKEFSMFSLKYFKWCHPLYSIWLDNGTNEKGWCCCNHPLKPFLLSLPIGKDLFNIWEQRRKKEIKKSFVCFFWQRNVNIQWVFINPL